MVDEDDEAGVGGPRLSCSCGGLLAPWGYARLRRVRELGGRELAVRPRRARCQACGTTTVLLPCSTLVRRRDSVEVIGAALLAHARGQGHRSIAADLDRPVSTVRGWLRRAGSLTEVLRRHGTIAAHQLDPLLGPIAPTGSPLGDALEALGTAAAATRRRLGGPGGWPCVAWLTGGRLLAPSSRA